MSREKEDSFDQLLKNHLSGSRSRLPAESCPDENRIAAYLEGSQSEPFKKAFERHLLQCDRCQTEMASLLNSGVMETQPQPAPSVSTEPRTDLLALLFGWMRVTAFRPVFAILVVSVVTGVVGYQVLREKDILHLHPTKTTESARLNTAPVAAPDESSPAQSAQERLASDKSEMPLARHEPIQDQLRVPRLSRPQSEDRVGGGKTGSRDSLAKDTYATEPPSTVPAEPKREAIGERERLDVTAISQPLPEPLPKESQPAAVERQTSPVQTTEEKASAQAKNEAASPAAPPPARGALGAFSRAKIEQDSVADAKEERSLGASLKKKQSLSGGPAQVGAVAAAEAKAVSRIEVGGKRFDLSGGLWRDASIVPNDPQPTLINVNSPDFETVRKQLAPYQPLLSRPEDVLIKLDNQVYRVQKVQKAPR